MDEQAIEQDPAQALLNALGDRFIALGQAIKRPETPLTELAKMAFDLGLTMQVRFVPRDQEAEPLTDSASMESE